MNSYYHVFTPPIDDRFRKVPAMHRIQQIFNQPAIAGVEKILLGKLNHLKLETMTKPGQTVAVAVGSRGIHQLPEIVKNVVTILKDKQLEPWIVPAMGSHGGASAEGQAAVLKKLGISEETMGVPVKANVDVQTLGDLSSGARVFFLKQLMAADHTVVINRIKPHTLFRSEVESGLCKMLSVGCGAPSGAVEMHRFGPADAIVPAAQMILDQANVLFGIAVVETSKPGIHSIETVAAKDFIKTDRRLLTTAWELFPKIPVETLDILLVDEMGKNISGTGMDPNVIGFWRREGGVRTPDYNTLIVLDLTSPSRGNAIGIGMADLTTKRLMEKIDLNATQTNSATTGQYRTARLPITLATDCEAISLALSRVSDLENVRMVRIKNTHTLETFWATPAVLPQLEANSAVTISEKKEYFTYDNGGCLSPVV